MEFPFRAFFVRPEFSVDGFEARPIIQGWKKTREYGKKRQVLEFIGAKEGTRTPTGVTPQEPESCASTKFRHFRTVGRNTPNLNSGMHHVKLTFRICQFS